MHFNMNNNSRRNYWQKHAETVQQSLSAPFVWAGSTVMIEKLESSLPTGMPNHALSKLGPSQDDGAP
jgi:hypothetical protein